MVRHNIGNIGAYTKYGHYVYLGFYIKPIGFVSYVIKQSQLRRFRKTNYCYLLAWQVSYSMIQRKIIRHSQRQFQLLDPYKNLGTSKN